MKQARLKVFTGGFKMPQDKLRVLVVDDDEVSRTILREWIGKKHGHDVEEASTGKEAVDCFIKYDNYDLILADLRMPGMNGVEAIMEIRKSEKATGHYPTYIIVLTALVPPSQELGEVEPYINGCILKPVPFNCLDDLLNQAAMLKKVRENAS